MLLRFPHLQVSRALLLTAALLALAPSLVLPPSAAAQNRLDERYSACLELTGTATLFAYNEAKLFMDDFGGWRAEHCAGLALLLLDRPAEAAPLLASATKGSAGEPAEARAAIAALEGQAWYLAGDNERALTAQDLAAGLDAGRADYLIDRAFTLTAMEDYWTALDDLNRAHDLAPGNPAVLTLRASLYRRLEVPELALENAGEALALEPGQPDALLELALAKGALGDIEGALADIERLLKTAPESEAAQKARTLVDRLD